MLAFLPGMGEIRRAQAALAGCGALVLPLHGELPPAEQDLALRPAAGRRVVLATSVAETSLTVPGVRVVVDGGWRRSPRLDGATGLTRLHTVRVSRAAADQRAGRAGREAPGVAVRLWTAALHRGLAPFDPPELLGAELSSLLLSCAAWGTAPEALPFPDAPPAGALAAAAALLRSLGALDGERAITDAGGRMAALGAHPRLAAMMLAARTAPERALAADLAALLEERDPLRPRPGGPRPGGSGGRPGGRPGGRGAGPARGAASGGASVDLALRLQALRGEVPEDGAEVDRAAVARIRQGAAQYRRRLGVAALPGAGAGPSRDASPGASPGAPSGAPSPATSASPGASPDASSGASAGVPPPGAAAALVAAAFPDRVAQRRGEPGSFRLSGGGGARLGRDDPLAAAPLLAVASLEGGSSATIRLAAPLDPAALPPALDAAVTETLEEGFDPATGAVLCRRRRRLGALVLEDRVVPPEPGRAALLLARALLARPEQLPWTEPARQLQARAALLRALDAAATPAGSPGADGTRGAAVPDAPQGGDVPDSWEDAAMEDAAVPDLSDAALAAAPEWLAPHLLGLNRLSEVAARLDLHAALRARLGAHAARLDRELPTHVALPGGRATVDYTEPVPVAAARAQHFFGLRQTPRLAGGRVALRLALLSPAGRPVAVTADLAGFWDGAWAEVRREMRGRYPRHDWPERP